MALTESEAVLAQLRALATARDYYVERLGWPVEIRVGQRRLVLATGRVADAVEVPRALAGPVLADLRIAILAGPVASDPTGDRWLFLAQPGDRNPTVEAMLAALGAQVIAGGGYVVLPGGTEGRGWHWVEPPRPKQPLPPWPAVVATIRRVGERGSDQSLAQCHGDGHGSVGAVELRQDVGDVPLHPVLGDRQPPGDLLVAQTHRE